MNRNPHFLDYNPDVLLARKRSGNFTYTDGVIPAPTLREGVVLKQGFNTKTHISPETSERSYGVHIQVTREDLFRLFMKFVRKFPTEYPITVILESSHNRDDGHHDDHVAHEKDLKTLRSLLPSYENLLVNDGRIGIALQTEKGEWEVRVDDHKSLSLITTSKEIQVMCTRLISIEGIPFNPRLQFLSDGKHFHRTPPELIGQFEELADMVGVSPTDPEIGDDLTPAY